MTKYTVVFGASAVVDADDPNQAVAFAQDAYPGLRAIEVHIGDPDSVNPPLIPCCECSKIFDILEQQEVDEGSFMCLPCYRDYTA